MKTKQDDLSQEISRRKHNVLNSPKQGGDAIADSTKYLDELNVSIDDDIQPIQFTQNMKQLVHRWAPYVQGFSSDFVQNMFEKYKKTYLVLVLITSASQLLNIMLICLRYQI
jgi:hypothetical protein